MAVVVLEGAAALRAQLKKLGDAVASEILLDAVTAGAEIVLKAMQETVPVETRALKRSLRIRVDRATLHKGRKRGNVRVTVGPGKGGAHGVPVELGHRAVRRSRVVFRGIRNQTVVRHVPPVPFMRIAFAQTKDAVEAEIQRRIAAGIDRVASQ